MTVLVCSLINKTPQTIQPGGDYQLLRFPFGSEESSDRHNMHQTVQPDGVTVTSSDPRAGLIWPAVAGWGWLTGMVFWEDDSGTATEFRARFCRDPLDLTTGVDSTATTDDPGTPGGDFRHYAHEMFVSPNTPIGLMVRFSGSRPLAVTLAEFKLAIDPDAS